MVEARAAPTTLWLPTSSAHPGGESCQRAHYMMGVRLNKRRDYLCGVNSLTAEPPPTRQKHPFLHDELGPEPSRGAPVPTN